MKRFILLLIGLCGCVGVDYLDDPVVGEKLIVSHQTLALLPNEKATVMADYFDRYGIQKSVALQWESSNRLVAEVTNAGLITAKSAGQTTVQPSFENFLGPQIQVTVVDNSTQVAIVDVTKPSNTILSVGEKITLTATVKNVAGMVLNNKAVEWFSENNNILAVTQNGQVEALQSGVASIHAKVEGVKSNILDFTVAGFARLGTFQSAGGYQTSGSARLEIVSNKLNLMLSGDFNTDFALGTFVYLANSTNGATVRSAGVELGQIFKDGTHSFDIGQVNSAIGLNDYKYVIILCKPASVTFGFAELK